MSILWRSWITLASVIATVLVVLATLVILQHNATLSQLTRERLSVVAQTTAASFRALIDLGLPLSMMRGGDQIVAESRSMDDDITAIHVFNPSGIVVYSTDTSNPGAVSPAVIRAQALSSRPAWSVETDGSLDSGYSIVSASGQIVGGVVVDYSKASFNDLARNMVDRTIVSATILWAIFSAMGFVVLRLLLAGPVHGFARLQAIMSGEEAARDEVRTADNDAELTDINLLRGEVSAMRTKFAQATDHYKEARSTLEALATVASERRNVRIERDASPPPVFVGQVPGVSVARLIVRRLTPWAAALVLGSAILLGAIAFQTVRESLEPELEARTSLIGTVVGNNVQRAVSAGVPIDDLVGAERYFGALLTELPEVAYIAVATGRIVLEAGQRIDPYLAPARARKDVLTYPIEFQGEEIGYIIIDIDPDFISKAFFDVFLDYGVVLLVTILIAFEVMILTTSVSLTAPFDRLQHLVTLQAASDFSKRVNTRTRNVVDGLIRRMSNRAERLHALMAGVRARVASGDGAPATAEDVARLERRYRLSNTRPAPLIFTYFTDIRLALFLFCAADELPLSFFPLFVRSAENPWPWLDQEVVISLPLAGYLFAILFASPFARDLADRFGHRNLLVMAMVPTTLAHLGLYFATSVPEIIIFRILTGFGFAFVTLACQDYVIDIIPKHQRDRSLAMFATVVCAGTFAGTAMGGVLADRLGQTNVFVVSAVLVIIGAVLVIRLLPGRGLLGQRHHAQTRLSLTALFTPLRNRHFAALVVGIAIPSNVLLQAFISYLVALLMDSLGASAAEIGRTLMLYFLMIALVGPLAVRIFEQRLQASIVASAGAMLSGLALLTSAYFPSEIMVVAAVVLCGIGHGLIRGPQVSIAMHIAETDLAHIGSNAVLGSLRSLERGGSILGLLAIALVAGLAGYETAMAVMGFWVLAGLALYLLVIMAQSGTQLLRKPDSV